MSQRAAWGKSFRDADGASIMEWELGGTVTNALLNENSPWGYTVVMNKLGAAVGEDENPRTYLYRYLEVWNEPDALYYAHSVEDDGRLLCELIEGKEPAAKDRLWWYIPVSLIEYDFSLSYNFKDKVKGGSK